MFLLPLALAVAHRGGHQCPLGGCARRRRRRCVRGHKTFRPPSPHRTARGRRSRSSGPTITVPRIPCGPCDRGASRQPQSTTVPEWVGLVAMIATATGLVIPAEVDLSVARRTADARGATTLQQPDSRILPAAVFGANLRLRRPIRRTHRDARSLGTHRARFRGARGRCQRDTLPDLRRLQRHRRALVGGRGDRGRIPSRPDHPSSGPTSS